MLPLLLMLAVEVTQAALPTSAWHGDVRLVGQAEGDVAERAAAVNRLGALPHDEALTTALVELLDARGAADARPFAVRLAALEVLVAQAPPGVAAPLMRVHVRSRAGDLPEDPDLFERALRGLQQLPPAEVEAALGPGLASGQLDLALDRLVRRWGAPLAQGDERLTRRMERWPTVAPDAWEASTARLTAELEGAWAAHGMALVDALQTSHGSLGGRMLEKAEDAVLAGWMSDPILGRIGEEIAEDRGVRNGGRPQALAPPSERPGHVNGQPSAVPEVVPDSVWRHGAAHRHRRLPGDALLLGVGLLLGAVLLRRRRHLAALAGGLALVPLTDAALGLVGVVPLLQTEPLFALTEWQVDVLQPAGPGLVQSGPGSVRHQVLTEQPLTGTLRVAVLGASSAHGSNHLREEAFAALIEATLDTPASPVEVVNLGIGGTISTGVAHAGRAALTHGAGLIIVYYGHNEVAQFNRLALYEHTALDVLPMRLWLHQRPLYSALVRAVQPTGRPVVHTEGSLYAESAPTRAQIDQLRGLAVAHYRHNLDQLIREAEEKGAGVILVNPATNYPLAHVEPHLTPGPGDAEDLVARREAARSAAAAGDPDGVRAARQATIDVSASPREVTSGIRAALAELAEAHHTGWLDADALFWSASPDGLSANGLFWDDLHPSRQGHALLADALVPLVRPWVDCRSPTCEDDKARGSADGS